MKKIDMDRKLNMSLKDIEEGLNETADKTLHDSNAFGSVVTDQLERRGSLGSEIGSVVGDVDCALCGDDDENCEEQKNNEKKKKSERARGSSGSKVCTSSRQFFGGG